MIKKTILAIAISASTLSIGQAQDIVQQDQYYEILAKKHFELAIKQFENKDNPSACSNLRISSGYARQIVSNTEVYDYVNKLLNESCNN
jgi:hypothetical protein